MRTIICISLLLVVALHMGGAACCLAAEPQQSESLFPVDGLFLADEEPAIPQHKTVDEVERKGSSVLALFSGLIGALVLSVFVVVASSGVYRRVYKDAEQKVLLAEVAYRETSSISNWVRGEGFVRMNAAYETLEAERSRLKSEQDLLGEEA